MRRPTRRLKFAVESDFFMAAVFPVLMLIAGINTFTNRAEFMTFFSADEFAADATFLWLMFGVIPTFFGFIGTMVALQRGYFMRRRPQLTSAQACALKTASAPLRNLPRSVRKFKESASEFHEPLLDLYRMEAAVIKELSSRRDLTGSSAQEFRETVIAPYSGKVKEFSELARAEEKALYAAQVKAEEERRKRAEEEATAQAEEAASRVKTVGSSFDSSFEELQLKTASKERARRDLDALTRSALDA